MGEEEKQSMEGALRDHVGRLVGNASYWRSHPVYAVLGQMRRYEGNAFLCGGACRDLLLGKGRIVPRDLDIIVQYVSMEDLAHDFRDCVKNRTRYGGLTIEVRDWEIDIWPLSETWAFKHAGIPGNGLCDFGRTTFLDIEAIAVQLFTRRGQRRKVYSNGFFEAIHKRTIEINLEMNPYPARCVLKSIALAIRYNFALGPRLARYINYHATQIGLAELVEVGRIRYLSPKMDAPVLGKWLQGISEQLKNEGEHPARLLNSENLRHELLAQPE
jgi:hypothetical protein